MDLRSLFRLVFDRDSARRTERETQDAIRRGTDPKAAEQNVGRIRNALEGVRSVAVKLAGVLGIAFSVRAIMRFGQEARLAHESLASSLGTLEVQLGNIGVAFADVRDEVSRVSDELWRTHRLGSEEFVVTMTELVKTTGDYEQSLRHVGMAANLAAATGTSLEKAAQRVGRVLQGDIGWMARYGWAVEDTAEALELLETRIAGAAAAGPTVSEEFAKTWARLRELVGEFLYEAGRVDNIIQKATATVQWMIDNFDRLANAIGAVAKAIMVAGAVLAFNRLRIAVLGANVAASTFLATLRGFYALMGPKGWLILGVAALAEVFRRAGEAAREAAREAKEAHEEFLTFVRGASMVEIEQEIARLARRRRELSAEIEEARRRVAETPATGQYGVRAGVEQAKLVSLEREYVELQKQATELFRRRGELQAEAQRQSEKAGRAEEVKIDVLREEIDLLRQGHDLGVLSDAERARAIELERELLRRITSGNRGLEERVKIQEALNRIAPVTPDALDTPDARISPVVSVQRKQAGFRLPDRVDPLPTEGDVRAAQAAMDAVLEFHDAATSAAYGMANAWADAFGVLRQEGEETRGFFETLGAGLGAAMLGGLAQYAAEKVRQNIASAVEAFAWAAGFKAFGNFASASEAAKAGAGHLAAAGAWSALGGGLSAGQARISGGGGAGLAGGLPSGAADIGGRMAAGAGSRAVEFHVHIDPFDPRRPAHQRKVYAANRLAAERFTEDADIYIHDSSGRP